MSDNGSGMHECDAPENGADGRRNRQVSAKRFASESDSTLPDVANDRIDGTADGIGGSSVAQPTLRRSLFRL